MELSKDLMARQEARNLCEQALKAQQILSQMSQEQLDAICKAVAESFQKEAATLAKQAVAETGFGNEEDKTEKNRFASKAVYEAIKDRKCVGVLKEDAREKLWEVGVPVGVIGAIVPSTNPTSTVCYKALIALKSGNAIVFSPHPKAINCTLHAVQVVAQAARQAGAPEGTVSCLTAGAMAGCQELMAAPQVSLLLATGGPAMVRACYSSGKPAIGVGAGNGPAYIHPSADIPHALSCIAKSKNFDYGTICASEQSIIVEKSLEKAVLEEGRRQGFYLMKEEEAAALAKLLFKPNGTLSPDVVGKPAGRLAQMAGFCVPHGTKILMARERQAGPTSPYSMEKLCPVLAFFVMENEDAVLAKCVEVLRHEGSGHTFSIHTKDEKVVRKFALQIPVSRFLVNTPSALGGIGASTNLFPALTLGCGAVGGSSTSNNVSPMDLINVRRVAWGKDEETVSPEEDTLVAFITSKILERLGG